MATKIVAPINGCCHNLQISETNQVHKNRMAGVAGLEPATPGFGVKFTPVLLVSSRHSKTRKV
jgi:hypothetical protein